MGDPKKQRKKYDTPRFPWQIDVLREELNLLGQYGLRNKRELWRHKTMLSKFRGFARSTLGMPKKEGERLKDQLLKRLYRLGILPETATLDDVLDLAIVDILERRLQSLVFRKGLAKSIHQSRQLVTHGHISVKARKVTSPSCLVLRDDEPQISYTPSSSVSKPGHPLRQTIPSIPQVEVEERQTKGKAA